MRYRLAIGSLTNSAPHHLLREVIDVITPSGSLRQNEKEAAVRSLTFRLDSFAVNRLRLSPSLLVLRNQVTESGVGFRRADSNRIAVDGLGLYAASGVLREKKSKAQVGRTIAKLDRRTQEDLRGWPKPLLKLMTPTAHEFFLQFPPRLAGKKSKKLCAGGQSEDGVGQASKQFSAQPAQVGRNDLRKSFDRARCAEQNRQRHQGLRRAGSKRIAVDGFGLHAARKSCARRSPRHKWDGRSPSWIAARKKISAAGQSLC